MRRFIIFATATFLFIAVIYIAKRSFFLSNVAGLAYSKLKSGVDLNDAIAWLNKELVVKRNTFCGAGDATAQLENGVSVNDKSDKYNMFCYSFFEDNYNPCKSAY